MKNVFFILGLVAVAAIGVLFAEPGTVLAAEPFGRAHAMPAILFGGLIINRQNLSIVSTGFKTTFNNAFETAQTDFEKVAMVIASSTKQEVYGWLGKTTRFREWIGERVLQNLATHDYTIKNKSFENTVTVDRDDIQDDSYGIYNPLVQQLGMDAKNHPDELVFALIKAGFTGFCYDGQYFFDTDHPVIQADGSVGSVSNFGGGAGTPWFLLDTSKAIKPFIYQKRSDYQFVAMDQATDEMVFSAKAFRYGVDGRGNVGYGLWQLAYASKDTLNADNFNNAMAAMSSLKGDQGRPLNVRPTLLVVPPTLRDKALTIAKAAIVNNTTNVNQGAVDVLVTPWLA